MSHRFSYKVELKESGVERVRDAMQKSVTMSGQRIELRFKNIRRGIRYIFSLSCQVDDEPCRKPNIQKRIMFACLGTSSLQ